MTSSPAFRGNLSVPMCGRNAYKTPAAVLPGPEPSKLIKPDWKQRQVSKVPACSPDGDRGNTSGDESVT
jgi:hypothetical protein